MHLINICKKYNFNLISIAHHSKYKLTFSFNAGSSLKYGWYLDIFTTLTALTVICDHKKNDLKWKY